MMIFAVENAIVRDTGAPVWVSEDRKEAATGKQQLKPDRYLYYVTGN